MRRRLAAPFAFLTIRPVLQPSRLVIAPQDIRTADPIVASDIYAGFFALGGKVMDAHGRSPFELEPPSPAWAEALHGFGWLRHLRAADTSLARANAQALVADWLAATRRGGGGPLAWRTATVARRLISWLSQSPVILEGADARFYRPFMRAIAYQGALLRRRLAEGLEGEERLLAALALTELALCSEDGRPYRHGTRLFLQALAAQVLPDGGHVSRDPGMLVSLLLDLLPLRQAYAARGVEVPAPLLNAIDRMIPMLRLFRHGDGAMALFNGMGVSQPDTLATILTYDDSRSLPLANAPRTGYQRVEAGGSVLICDTGRPPPPAFAARAHAGPLAFEFSSGAHRIVVNCGHPAHATPRLLAAARATAAHSTLTIADRSCARFGEGARFGHPGEDVLLDGPATCAVERHTLPEHTTLSAFHDGYAALGAVHRRQLVLASPGHRLEGEDRLEGLAAGPAPALRYALRFHLHPAARATVATGGRGIVVALPGGERWLFETDAPGAAIEPSIFFAGAEGPRPTEQIVVEAASTDRGAVRWALTRQP